MNISNKNKKYYKEYWNDNMIDYLAVSAGGRWFQSLFHDILELINPADINSAVDVGCGVGTKTAQMADYFPSAKVIGYDFSNAGIQAARKHFKSRNLTFKVGDITTSHYGQRFDLITAFDVLEHVEDWKGLTKKLSNINNKYMIISSPVGRMRPYEVEIGHVRNFRKNEIEDFMISQGYKTVRTFYAGFPFYSPIIRDLTNIFYPHCADSPKGKVGFMGRRIHDVWFILFRYFSSKNKGDIFVGLFERVSNDSTNKIQ